MTAILRHNSKINRTTRDPVILLNSEMTEEIRNLKQRMVVARSELNNLRNKLKAFQHQHRKDVSLIRNLLEQPSVDLNPSKVSKSDDFKFQPIGYLRTVYPTKNGTPRQPNLCKGSTGVLEIEHNNPEYALDGVINFSHLWILFVFHMNRDEGTKAKVTPPRLGQRVGVFSTRSPHRPNPIGLSLVKLEKIEGKRIYLSGLDIIDGTPVLDIKPYIPDYDSIPASQVTIPSWIKEGTVTNLEHVIFTHSAMEDLKALDKTELIHSVSEILKADPRSKYRRTKCQDRLYYFVHDDVHFTAWFDDEKNVVQVLKAKINETQ